MLAVSKASPKVTHGYAWQVFLASIKFLTITCIGHPSEAMLLPSYSCAAAGRRVKIHKVSISKHHRTFPCNLRSVIWLGTKMPQDFKAKHFGGTSNIICGDTCCRGGVMLYIYIYNYMFFSRQVPLCLGETSVWGPKPKRPKTKRPKAICHGGLPGLLLRGPGGLHQRERRNCRGFSVETGLFGWLVGWMLLLMEEIRLSS